MRLRTTAGELKKTSARWWAQWALSPLLSGACYGLLNAVTWNG